MTLAITVNNADYSSNSIGWEAPTTVQPASALFALNNTASLKNLAASSRQPTTIKGSPVFTAGVAGASLPFETLGSSGRIETYTTLPQKSTIISLLRMGSGQANVMSMGITTASFQILQRSGEWNNWVVCGGGSDQITVNTALTAGTWQICAWQCDLSSRLRTHSLR
ncbi:hypothetical protein [Acetobacter persici]|uniref:Uncharacterized protein n=1 Tax=Acetobacter persici TaxID=1076596 RepID=A0A1U9LBB0_9PROT|nr:hypothetical protein [Acetobacter persici]AQT03734.1 hypothetical protein A0U91_00260 [Acetobacter persici]